MLEQLAFGNRESYISHVAKEPPISLNEVWAWGRLVVRNQKSVDDSRTTPAHGVLAEIRRRRAAASVYISKSIEESQKGS
jgi:hypothetical protein